MFLIELAGDIQETGGAFEDGHGLAVLFDVHNSWYLAIRIDGREPLRFGISRA